MATSPATSTPRELLARYHQSMIQKDADALADLYDVDAVHEFPLLTPFFPQRLQGREQIRKHYRAVWGASPIHILEVREIAVHETTDPKVIIAEAEFVGDTTPAKAPFVQSFLVVMWAENGRIAHLRDYMDALGAAYNLDRLPVMVEALERGRRG